MRNTTENQIECVFLRHGMTPGNAEKRYIGRTEEHLSKLGINQILSAKEKMNYTQPELLFVSPMKRCLETADLLFPDIQKQEIELFKEMDFGDFEGKNYQELSGEKTYQEWIDSCGELPFPNGESKGRFVARCMQGMEQMLQRTEAQMEYKEVKNMNITAVVHGGTIMAVLSSMYGGNYYDYQVPCGLGYKCHLVKREGNWEMESIGLLEPKGQEV